MHKYSVKKYFETHVNFEIEADTEIEAIQKADDEVNRIMTVGLYCDEWRSFIAGALGHLEPSRRFGECYLKSETESVAK